MSISRRVFLSLVGVVGLFSVVGEKIKADPVGSFIKFHNSSGSVLHDSNLCLGCRKCEEVCNLLNELPKPERTFSDLTVLSVNRRTTSKTHTVVNQYSYGGGRNKVYYKKQCNHCLEPACSSVCFVGALKKTKEGPVVYDSSVCVGCRYCMIACPFEIPTYEYDNAFNPKIMKCNMCYERVAEGLLPGCVNICPSGALIFGTRSKLLKIAKKRINENSGKYIDHVYGEYEMGGTSWLYISRINFDKIGMRSDLGTLAAGHYTSPALSAVPIIVGLWPVFLAGVYAIKRRREKLANNKRLNDIKVSVEEVEEKCKKEISMILEKNTIDNEKTLKIEIKKALTKAGVETSILIDDDNNE